MSRRKTLKKVLLAFCSMSLLLLADLAFAQASGSTGLAKVADSVTASMGSFALLITSTAYIAGLGFAMASIFKFMAHKNNPTQVTIGQPIAMLFVAAALLFLPSVFSAAGGTLFGAGATATGVTGTTSITATPGSGGGSSSTAPGTKATTGLGQVANNVTDSMGSFALLITACSYIAGLGFAMASIFKFMAHKNNPTQVTIGQPIAMLFVAAALLFLPSVFGAAGATLFGTDGKSGEVTGTMEIPKAK
jgi:intracellular multiplication protein IcmD